MEDWVAGCGSPPGAEECKVADDDEEAGDAFFFFFFLIKEKTDKSSEGPLGNIQECLKQKRCHWKLLHPEVIIVNSLIHFLFGVLRSPRPTGYRKGGLQGP